MILIENAWLNKVIDIKSDRSIALASHHLILKLNINLQLDKRNQELETKPHTKYNYEELRNKEIASNFANFVWHHLSHNHSLNTESLDIFNYKLRALQAACESAARSILPEIKACPKKPCIGDSALQFIEQHSEARIRKDWNREK